MNIKELCITKPGLLLDDNSFMSWFNKSSSVEDSLRKGSQDFHNLLFDKKSKDYLGDVSEKKCLEIGFGGGRLLSEACNNFGHCTGIDIHDSFDRTKKILSDKLNFRLMHSDDIDLIETCSIDFVYSFIVFQHFTSWSVAERYLEMIDRVLVDNGLAIVYFGRLDNGSIYVSPESNSNDWWMSMNVSKLYLEKELSKRFKVLEIDQRPGSKQIFARFKKNI